MTMQLKQISLYGNNGKRRDVEFELGAVNIITGASKKGKTSLIDIVEYCLGSSECDIAVGCIRDTVAWYSILLEFPDTQVFIARAAPLPGAKSNSASCLRVENVVTVPEGGELTAETNISSVVSFLTSKIGIPEFVTEVPDNQTRSPIHIGFKHSRHYLFQSQYEIADPKLLFHRQGEPHIPQSIKDTMPYFIGAVEDDRLADIQKLRSLKQDRTRLLKKINEIESLKGEGLEKGYGLLAEAADVGLYNNSNLIPGEKELLGALKEISLWKAGQIGEPSDSDDGDPLIQLQDEYRGLVERKQIVRSRLRDAVEYESSETSFEGAVSQQVVRLQSVRLFEKIAMDDDSRCSVCDSAHSGKSRFHRIVRGQLVALDGKLDGVGRIRPRVQSYVAELKQEQKRLAQNIKRTRDALSALRLQSNRTEDGTDVDILRARVVGRVSLYIEGIDWQEDTGLYRQSLSLIEPQIEALSEKLDPEVLKEKLDAQLSCIAEDMTRWSRRLNLEHSEHRIRLDHKKLTIVAETPHGATPLSTMGSGANWVGYHLVTYVALAKWFIEQGRPVGRFIFFDQPTQAFFPADAAETGSLESVESDEDRKTVREIFKWLIEVVGEVFPNLQIIVTDHADIDEDWYQGCIRDVKWRGSDALIPEEWMEE